CDAAAPAPIPSPRRWRNPSCRSIDFLHASTNATIRSAARFGKSPPAGPSRSPREDRDIRSESYRKLSAEKQRHRAPEGIGRAQRVLDFDLKPLAVLEDDVVDAQSLK